MIQKKILVIGSLNIDLVVRMKEMPLTGETILGQSVDYVPGGKGANQACACARLGGDIAMIGCVGDDDFGTQQMNSLKNAGADISQIKRVPQIPTGLAVIYVNDEGNNSIVVIPSANACCDRSYLESLHTFIAAYDILVLQMEIPYDAIVYAARTAKELGKTVILNPAPAPEQLPQGLAECVDIITPNETELAKLSGCKTDTLEEIAAAARVLTARGIGQVVVTLGSQGAMYITPQTQVLYPTPAVKVVDTTAAGDTFNGALAVYLAEGHPIGEAMTFANKAASVSVTRKGAQTSIPTRKEVLQ